jgi:hypothetical protein
MTFTPSRRAGLPISSLAPVSATASCAVPQDTPNVAAQALTGAWSNTTSHNAHKSAALVSLALGRAAAASRCRQVLRHAAQRYLGVRIFSQVAWRPIGTCASRRDT